MSSELELIVEKIAQANPVAGKKLRRNFKKFDDEHRHRAEDFLKLYTEYLNSINKTIDFSIECYLKMMGDMFYERMKFLETGVYSNRSYKEVNEKVYGVPDVMDYHMHGLILAQFLWPDQYIRFKFFSENLRKYEPIRHYLEVGGGHGVFVAEAVRILGSGTRFVVNDISKSSIELCRNLVKGGDVDFILKDIFEYSEKDKFDFITIGEVIEHLEDPKALLKKLHSMLNDNGSMYLTTPVNAPMIDHIYLFKNVTEIRELLIDCGFRITEEIQAYSDEMPEELAIQHKIPLMYACFLKKSK